MPKQQSPMEIRARALEAAADWLEWAPEVASIACEGPSNAGQIAAQYDAALEDPGEWLRTRANELRDSHALTLGYIAEYKTQKEATDAT